MDIKQFLKEIRAERREIALLEKRILKSKLKAIPSGISYDRDKVQTSPRDSMSEAMIESADYEKELEKHLNKLMARSAYAARIISSVPAVDQRRVLEAYYLHMGNPTWEEVADMLDFSVQRIYQLHGDALVWLRSNHHLKD